MNKLTKIAAVMVALLVAASPLAFAATDTSGALNISANVASNFDLTVVLHENTSTGTIVGAMNFGTLSGATGTLRSSTTTGVGSVVAVMNVVSTEGAYEIRQTSSAALTSGANTIPTGACTVVPVYAAADNGGAALVGTLGTSGTWVATDKVLYTSDATGSLRTIQAHYAIVDSASPGATANVPLSQPTGTYTNTVTFTAVEI